MTRRSHSCKFVVKQSLTLWKIAFATRRVTVKAATFLGIFRNFAVIFPKYNMVRFSPAIPFRAQPVQAFRLSSIWPMENRESRKNRYRRSHGVVFDERDLPHMRAMLTMPGISYLSKENGES